MKRLRRLSPVVLAATLLAGAAPAEPDSFRMNDYRADVPATLGGHPAMTTVQAAAAWREGAATFVDTLPQVPRPAGLPEGTIWNPKPRSDIPGSIWLPDTGYGALAPAMERYFTDNLDRATHGDRSHPLVFYCLAKCWMSWNAARRAIGLGYSHVFWFSDGTDGWAAAGLPLERREPEPRPE